jgi:hypothetical protein
LERTNSTCHKTIFGSLQAILVVITPVLTHPEKVKKHPLEPESIVLTHYVQKTVP